MASYAKMKDRARNNAAIYSVIAIAILIAIPATVAYAETSDSTIYTPLKVNTDDVNLYVVANSAETPIDSISSTNQGILNYVIDGTVSAPTHEVHLMFNNAVALSDVHKIWIDSDLNVDISSATLYVYVGSTLEQYDVFTYNDTSGRLELDASTIDRLHWSNVSSFLIMFRLAENVTSINGEVDIGIYEANTLFTDNVIEMIALISGILLIVFALFATPWISVPQVTRTARKAARSVKSGAKKTARSVKRSVKKR